MERYTAGAGEARERVSEPTQAVGRLFVWLLGLPLVLLLVGIIIHRILKLLSRDQLVITELKNASGDDVLDKMLPGMTGVFVERLLLEAQTIRQMVQTSEERGYNDWPTLPDEIARPQSAGEKADDLINAVKAAVPAPFGSFVPLFKTIFTPRGVQVSGVLQRRGDDPGRLGVTMEVLPLSGSTASEPYTIWEPRFVKAAVTVTPTPEAPNGLGESLAQAPAYLLVGQALHDAGFFEDAIPHLETALRLEPDGDDAAATLAACVSKRQVQQSAGSAYAAGEMFRSVGMMPAAVTAFRGSFPPATQPDAAVAWNTLLGPPQGDEAAAHSRLADLYKVDGVCLYDEAVKHYTEAAKLGWAPAAVPLADLRNMRAAGLVVAGRILTGLTLYADAEKYILRALEYVPEHEVATAALTTLKSEAPPPGDKKTQGLLALANICKGRGALEKAMEYYVEAVKEQPSSGEAQAGLAKVLNEPRTLSERHYALRRPVARWLVLELLRRDMGAERRFAGSPGGIAPSESNRDDAEAYNLLGVLYQASGPTHGAFFYDLAIRDFERAIQLYPTWYQPRLYLGYTYSLKGRHPATSNGRSLQLRAVQSYNDALTCLTSGDVEKVTRELRVWRATALMLSGSIESVTEGMEEMVNARNNWNSAAEKDSHLLYNMASWFDVAVSMNVGVMNAASTGRRYLAYSFGRDKLGQLLRYAASDPDVKNLLEGVDINAMEFKLIQARWTYPDLEGMEAALFWQVMNNAILAAGWG